MRYKGIICLILGIGGSIVSCNDDWDEHYSRNGSIPEVSLMDMILNDSQLTKFSQILMKTGADSLLTSTQTYTVWAPVDEALSSVDMDDEAALQRMVKNHIARYSNSTATEVGKSIYMLDGKVMSYESADVFNGISIVQKDILAQNGILHKLNDTIPYRYNFWEYISTQENYSKIYDFINQFSEKIYVSGGSNKKDSVFKDYNRLLQNYYYGIGWIHDEDSVYTMILPDNEAWDKAYEQVSPYFKVYNADEAVADSITKVQTGQAIVYGLTFGGRITDPGSADTLVTVTGNVIRSTKDYFAGYRQELASNGLMFLADGNLHLDDTCVWNQPIIVEGEDLDRRLVTASGTSPIIVEGEDLDRRLVTASGTSAYVRDVDGTSVVKGISENSYLEVSGSSLNPGVTFDIPNVLATKYDIYVDFVPPAIDGNSRATEKTCLSYRMKVEQENGRTKYENRQGKNDEELIVGGDSVGDVYMKTVKVWSAYQFPTSDFYDAMWYLNEDNADKVNEISPKTTLEIKANVSPSELNVKYVRRFRIDRIRFVPAKNN